MNCLVILKAFMLPAHVCFCICSALL